MDFWLLGFAANQVCREFSDSRTVIPAFVLSQANNLEQLFGYEEVEEFREKLRNSIFLTSMGDLVLFNVLLRGLPSDIDQLFRFVDIPELSDRNSAARKALDRQLDRSRLFRNIKPSEQAICFYCGARAPKDVQARIDKASSDETRLAGLVKWRSSHCAQRHFRCRCCTQQPPRLTNLEGFLRHVETKHKGSDIQ